MKCLWSQNQVETTTSTYNTLLNKASWKMVLEVVEQMLLKGLETDDASLAELQFITLLLYQFFVFTLKFFWMI